MTVAIGALISASAVTASAQNSVPTNPWYIPPASQAPAYGYGHAQPSPAYGGYGQQGHSLSGTGYHQPQAYQPPQQQNFGTYVAPGTTSSLPQPSLGAGYSPQQPDYRELLRQEQYSSIDTGAVPGPYGQQPNGGYWQRQPAAPQPAYTPPSGYAAPTYGPPSYRAAPQPFGDYPPLGSDPTLTPRNSADRGAAERQPETASRNTAGSASTTQRWSSAPPAYTDPLLAGPTTLAPYGSGYGAPYGAYGGFAPFPGLPFW